MNLLNVYLSIKDKALEAKDIVEKWLKVAGEAIEKALGKDDDHDPPAFT